MTSQIFGIISTEISYDYIFRQHPLAWWVVIPHYFMIRLFLAISGVANDRQCRNIIHVGTKIGATYAVQGLFGSLHKRQRLDGSIPRGTQYNFIQRTIVHLGLFNCLGLGLGPAKVL